MKKLFFSAIFLVAVSSVSMASTITEKQVVIDNVLPVNTLEKMGVPKIDVCAVIAIAVYHETIMAGINTEEASQEALAVYNECIAN